MQADALAGLLGASRHDARRHLRRLGRRPGVAADGLAPSRRRRPGWPIWWISGGVFGLLSLATHYCGGSLAAAWTGGMDAVVALPEWSEVLEGNAENKQRFLDQDPATFIATMERWMLAYCPRDGEPVPGLVEADARALDIPALVFRSGVSDPHHTRATSEALAAVLPHGEAGGAAMG